MKRTLFITMLAAALLGAQGRADVTPSTITGYTYEEGIGGSWINHSYYGAYSESGNVSGGGVQIKADPSGTDHIHHELIGGYAECGDAFSNAVTMNGGEVGALCGGSTGIVKYGTPYGGNSYSNSVTVNGGVIFDEVVGGRARENRDGSGGSANNNSVTLTNVQPYNNPYGVAPIEVFGGYGEYDAYRNSVTVTGSGAMRIWGGYAYDKDASDNTVSVTESQVTSVIGGKSEEGDACGNTVTIADTTVSEERVVDGIYGGYAEQGDANNNTVTVTGGQADTVEGGYGTNANGNTVTVSGVTIEYQVEGGRAFNAEGTANDNTVTMNGGRVGLIIAAIGDSTVGNTVVMNGGQTESICAGESFGGENSDNTVIVTEGELQYGISAGELFNGGELRNNRVYLVGKGATATIGGKQYTGGNAGIQAGGTIDAAYVFEDPEEGAPAFSASGNSIDVYGTGIKAGAVAYYGLTQALTFHLGDGLANAGEPLVTITSYGLNLTNVELGFRGDDVTDWSKFEGRSITLVQAADNVTGVDDGTEVNITGEGGKTLASATLSLGSGNALVLNFSGVAPTGQTSYTANPGSPQTSAPDTIYGAYAETGDVTGGSASVYAVATGGYESLGYVYGGYAKSGSVSGCTATMDSGCTEYVRGGYAESGDAIGNTVNMTGGAVEFGVYGGGAGFGDATGNTVIMTGGTVGLDVYGGYVQGTGDATGNTVIMTGGFAGWVVGGQTGFDNDATGNTVRLVGAGASYTIGDTTYQGGEIAIQYGVYAALAFGGGSSENNTVHIHGTGIGIGGSIHFSQQLNFHLVQGQAGAPGTPMVTLGGALDLEGVELGFYGDAVTNWAAFEGKSITLVQAADNVTGVEAGTEVDIINEVGGTLATATLSLGSGNALVLTFSGELPGGQTSYTANPGSPQTSAPDTIYGAYAETGDVTGGSAAVFAVATGGYESLGNVYGGYAKSGNVSGCTANMDSGSAEFVYGGISAVSDYSESYDATDNTVTVNGGEVAWDVDGGNTLIGNATGNTVNMNGGMVVRNVEGGVSYVGNATGNTVIMNGGEVGNVFGGSTNDGDATGNTVSMTGGEVADTLYGGYTTLGHATDNTVTLSYGNVGGYLYGGYVSEVSDDGNATGNTVIMNGGEVGVDVYGGLVEGFGDATGNTVILNNGDVNDDVCAGLTYKGEVSGNIVMMTGGSVSTGVYGAYSYEGNATGNTVLMAGGSAGYVYGGGAAGVYAATGNTVTMTGGEVAADVYGGFTESGEASGNTVRLVGKGASYTNGKTTYQGSEIAIQGSVYAGYAEEGGISANNTVHIHGTGIGIGGTIDDSQQLNFHLVQDQAGAPGTPMVTLGGALDLEGVGLGFYGDAVTNWAAFKGKSITLVQAAYNVTGVAAGTEVDITDEVGETLATATLTLVNGKALALTFPGDGPVPPPVPGEGPDALDVALVNSLWASSAYVREFVRLSEAQGYALKDGDTAVWGGGFGTFMHTTGDKGFKSNGGGYGIGVNHAFSADTYAGISLGQGFGSYHNSGADGATVHQRATLAAATLSTRITKDLSLGGHLAFGNVRNRADCRLDGASGRSRWNDNVFNLGARAAYDFHVTETTAVTPFLGLDWMNGAHESFTGGYGRHYTHGRLNELRMPVGVTVSTSVEAGSAKLLPQLSVAYVPSLAQQLPQADVSGENGDYRVKGYAPGRNAFMLNAGVNAVFSDTWSAGASYTLETRRHSVNQSVNASVRYTF